MTIFEPVPQNRHRHRCLHGSVLPHHCNTAAVFRIKLVETADMKARRHVFIEVFCVAFCSLKIELDVLVIRQAALFDGVECYPPVAAMNASTFQFGDFLLLSLDIGLDISAKARAPNRLLIRLPIFLLLLLGHSFLCGREN